MSLTETNLMEIYPNGLLPSSIPSTNNGLLTNTEISQKVLNLKNTRIIPPLEPADTFLSRQQAFLDNIKSEFDFYKIRYEFSLNSLFDSIKAANSTANEALINSKLNTTIALNKKLNVLTQIINGVTQDMLTVTNGLESTIRAVNRDNLANQTKLQEQNRIITSSQATTELNKQMVKFTEQKAKYSNNLLGLYSFLNVIALGLLVYVYKSASE